MGDALISRASKNSNVNIVQEAGTSTTDIMSQNAVTNELDKKIENKAIGERSISIGDMAETTSNFSVSMGYNTKTQNSGIAIGNSANSASYAISIGEHSNTLGSQNIAIGTLSTAKSIHSVAIGHNAKTNITGEPSGYVHGSVAIGHYATTEHEGCTAIGSAATVTGENSIALGMGSTAEQDNTLSIGSEYTQRRIVNVKDPINNQDAATKNYVDSQIASVPSGSNINVVQEAGTSTTNVMSQNACTENFALSNHNHVVSDLTSGTLPLSQGGTGASNAANARTNLDLYSKSEVDSFIQTLKSNFQDGCEKIASAITAEGVSTADNASPETMAANIKEIRSGGNATAKNILSGKTAYSGKEYITGTMTNQGAKTLTPTGNNTATSGAGYYSSVTADGSVAYTAGRNSKTLKRKVLDFTYDQGYVTDIDGYKTFTVDNFAICDCNLTLQTWDQGSPTAKTSTVEGASLSYNANTGNIKCTYRQPTHYINGSTQKMAAQASLNIKIVLYYAN